MTNIELATTDRRILLIGARWKPNTKIFVSISPVDAAYSIFKISLFVARSGENSNVAFDLGNVIWREFADSTHIPLGELSACFPIPILEPTEALRRITLVVIWNIIRQIRIDVEPDKKKWVGMIWLKNKFSRSKMEALHNFDELFEPIGKNS